MNLVEIKGFSRYAYDSESARVYSKSKRGLMAPVNGNNYYLIADCAGYRFGVHQRTYIHIINICARLNPVRIPATPKSNVDVKPKSELFLVMEVDGARANTVRSYTSEKSAKDAAESLAKASPGKRYGVFPLTTSVIASGVTWA